MIVLLHDANAAQDEHVVGVLEAALRQKGIDLFLDRRKDVGVVQAQLLGDWIRSSELVIAVISPESASSETFEYQLETVSTEKRKRGKPALITVRVNPSETITGPVGSYLLDQASFEWNGSEDDARVAAEVLAGVAKGGPAVAPIPPFEASASVTPTNRFYILRQCDAEMDAALMAREAVILVRGPRQIGKTSLIGRGAELVNALGWRSVATDFQKLNGFQLTDIDRFCFLLAKTMARQLDFRYDFQTMWADDFGPNLNLDHFVRSVLKDSPEPLVWLMDEADRIFTTPFASDFYGLVRSWHNARATDPKGPWSRFTVVIGYATEARLFIQDLNQSPFNVGRHVSLEGFNLQQTSELNDRYGSPLKARSNLEGMQFLLGGQPMLTRRALEYLAAGTLDYPQLIETADRDDGLFGDHLKRVLYAVSQAPDVLAALRSSLSYVPMSDSDAVQRLIAAGILRETSDGKATLACDLYAQYLARRLA